MQHTLEQLEPHGIIRIPIGIAFLIGTAFPRQHIYPILGDDEAGMVARRSNPGNRDEPGTTSKSRDEFAPNTLIPRLLASRGF